MPVTLNPASAHLDIDLDARRRLHLHGFIEGDDQKGGGGPCEIVIRELELHTRLVPTLNADPYSLTSYAPPRNSSTIRWLKGPHDPITNVEIAWEDPADTDLHFRTLIVTAATRGMRSAREAYTVARLTENQALLLRDALGLALFGVTPASRAGWCAAAGLSAQEASTVDLISSAAMLQALAGLNGVSPRSGPRGRFRLI